MSKINRLSSWSIPLLIVGVLLLAACSGSGSGSTSNKAVDVSVTLTDFKIDSSVTTFTQGVSYHFIATNKGSVEHELEIMPPDTGQLTSAQVQQMAIAGIGSDKLAAGATATLDYTFTKAYPEGSLELACHLPGHYEAGMHLPITVK